MSEFNVNTQKTSKARYIGIPLYHGMSEQGNFRALVSEFMLNADDRTELYEQLKEFVGETLGRSEMIKISVKIDNCGIKDDQIYSDLRLDQ